MPKENKVVNFFNEHSATSAVGLIIAIIIIMMSGMLLLIRQTCLSSYQEYQPRWGVWSDCRIQYNGKLTPTSMIKNINLNK